MHTLLYCAALALNVGVGRLPGASVATNPPWPSHSPRRRAGYSICYCDSTKRSTHGAARSFARRDSSPRCSTGPSQDVGTDAKAAAPVESLYPAWPVWERPPADYETIVSTFIEVTTAVPLQASSEKGDGWQT